MYIDFQSFFNFIVCNMAPKKKTVAQRAEQKRVANKGVLERKPTSIVGDVTKL